MEILSLHNAYYSLCFNDEMCNRLLGMKLIMSTDIQVCAHLHLQHLACRTCWLNEIMKTNTISYAEEVNYP